MKHKKPIPLPEGINVGDRISYYLNGWRIGTIQEVKGNLIGIKPVGTYVHNNQQLKWVGIDDIKKVEENK